jgi:hypothetical protein
MARWQTPQMPDPLAQYAKLQALKSGIAQQALQQQQLQVGAQTLQQKQLENQAAQQDLNDQRTLMTAAQDPDTLKAMTGWKMGTPFPLAGQISYKTQQAIQDKILKDQQTAFALDKDQRAADDEKRAAVGSALGGLMFDKDGKPRADADIAALAPGVFTDLMKRGEIPPGSQLPPLSGFQDAQRYAILNDYAKGINSYATTAQEAAAKIPLTQAQTAEAQGKGEQAAQEARKNKMVADAMAAAQANPQQGAALIDTAIPPTVDRQANNGYKAAWQAAMSVGNLDGAAKIVEAAAAHAASLSPATLQQAVKKEVAVKQAVAPIELANEIAKQKALAASSPEMFAGIQDPVSRRTAQSDYQKLTQDYYEKAQTGQQLQDFIAAAKSGNKAAPGLIPLSELRTVVNRVNRQELEAVSDNAGSVLDKVQGWFKGKTEGQPIPSDILTGMQQIADIETRNARSSYENKVGALASTYGGGVRPAPPPRTINAPAAGVKLQAPDGTISTVPADQVDHYLKLGAKPVQ